MRKEYFVDLTQRLLPGREANFELQAKSSDATEFMPQLQHDDDVWYIISRLDMCTHNGTHVEVPFHHLKDGLDVAQFPVNQMCGNMVLIDISDKEPFTEVTLDEMMKYDEQIEAGDIIFFKTGRDQLFRDPEHWCDYQYLSIDVINWIIQKGVICIGTDAAGIEDIGAKNQPGHCTLFRANIPLVESLTNLEKVESNQYIVFVLPLPIEGIEASPVRVIAIRKEGLAEEAARKAMAE